MKKHFNKLMAVITTAILAVTMSFGAFAAEETHVGVSAKNATSITIDKDLITDGKTVAPNGAEFNLKFEVPDDDLGNITVGGQTYNDVKKGIQKENIVVGKVQFSTSDSLESDNITYKKQFTIDVSGINFTEPGVYAYKVNEEGSYIGVTNDDSNFMMYVFVENKTSGTGVEVAYIVFSKTETTGEGTTNTKIDTITNDYGKNNDSTHGLIIEKIIPAVGLSNKNDQFTIRVKVDSDVAGEKFKIFKASSTGVDELVATVEDKQEQDLTVTDGTKYIVYGLTEGDAVTVQELENSKGYTATYEVSDNEVTVGGTTKGANVAAGTALPTNGAVINSVNDSAKITITNTKESVTPTGVAMDIAPYALMVVLAGSAAVTFLRKQDQFEE